MCQCWNHKPRERPSFSVLGNNLSALNSQEKLLEDFKINEDRPYFVLEPMITTTQNETTPSI